LLLENFIICNKQLFYNILFLLSFVVLISARQLRGSSRGKFEGVFSVGILSGRGLGVDSMSKKSKNESDFLPELGSLQGTELGSSVLVWESKGR